MPGTLLVPSPGTLLPINEKEEAILLDPEEYSYGPACRLLLVKGGKVQAWSFVGSLDPLRQPLSLFSGLQALLPKAGPSPTVRLFPVRPSPLALQTALEVSQVLQPDRVLTAQGSSLDRLPWPVGAEPIQGEKAPPEMVPEARRRREFSTLTDAQHLHPFDWTTGGLMGGRLGRGFPIPRLDDLVWAEALGGVLFVVSPEPLAEPALRRMMEDSGCDKVLAASPEDYKGLLVGLSRQDGSDFGLGIIERMDLAKRSLIIRSSFPPETPIPIVKLGGIKLDPTGRPVGSVKLWSL